MFNQSQIDVLTMQSQNPFRPLEPAVRREYITNFIEFQLPVDEDVSGVFDYRKADEELSKKWIGIMQPLREAMGWEGAWWGRIIERPHTMLLASG